MEISAGILFVKDGRVFMGHATETPYWDIPKGHVEEGESYREAAVRECREECGFIVDPSKLESIGLLDYTRTKKLALFMYNGEHYPDPDKAVCMCTFVNKDGRTIHEMDGFKYVRISELKTHARVTMGALLTKLIVG